MGTRNQDRAKALEREFVEIAPCLGRLDFYDIAESLVLWMCVGRAGGRKEITSMTCWRTCYCTVFHDMSRSLYEDAGDKLNSEIAEGRPRDVEMVDFVLSRIGLNCMMYKSKDM